MNLPNLLTKNSAGSAIRALDPPPLIDLQRHFCLLFSNKAGCTTLTKWFFKQNGELDQANAYHRWIHRYRIEVYLRRVDYVDALARISDPEIHRVKLVRSPFTRAVSSYLHAIRSSYADYELSEFFGRAINAVSGFSFREFVNYLECCDITRCNPHFRQQCSLAELNDEISIDRLMRLESLAVDLAALEKHLGMEPTDVDELSRSPHHNRQRVEQQAFCGEHVFVRSTRQFPDYSCFYNEALRSSIGAIYAKDFACYGYDPNTP